jgi:uncharacterized protein
MTPFRILLVSDGKPGHFRLAEGLCAAVERGLRGRRTVQIIRHHVVRRWWQITTVLSHVSNTGLSSPLTILTAIGGAPPDGPFNLVVSAGGDTLAANVSARRHYQCPNIFYGSLRRYQVEDFSLALTSYSAQVTRANQAMTLKPSAFDPDALRRPRRFNNRDALSETPVTIGLLVGGDSGTVQFAEADWTRLRDLVGCRQPNGHRWIVANSRRTPFDVSDQFAELAGASGGHVRFLDARSPEPVNLLTVLNDSDAIAVTVDSSSMVSEAIWSQRPVIVLSPTIASLPPLEETYRQDLSQQGAMTTVPLATITTDLLMTEIQRIKPRAENPLDQLAGLIRVRLPALFEHETG